MFKQSLILITLCVSLSGHAVYAGNDQRTEQGKQEGKRRGPPPEAFAACVNKQEGDTGSFKGRRGHDVQGTCMTKHEKLVLVPKHHQKSDKSGMKPMHGARHSTVQE